MRALYVTTALDLSKYQASRLVLKSDSLPLRKRSRCAHTVVSYSLYFANCSKFPWSNFPSIIYGESGTDKELVNRATHNLGLRGGFIKVNCPALTKSMLESELFSHVRGAYTDVYRDRPGRFENANTRTIFLDEIGDLSVFTQAALLCVLEKKSSSGLGPAVP